jgi:dipeptidyl aminopeptidase/acylaminoacyl peptidase
MMPILRGENGSPGAFTLFYDEVDDVLAAAAVLAEQPGVDRGRIYVSGHSAGGVLAAFAAMTSARFRAAAPLSAAPDSRPVTCARSSAPSVSELD